MRPVRGSRRLLGLGAGAAGAVLCLGTNAPAQAADGSAPPACTRSLSGALNEKWMALGGAAGLLGCPLSDPAFSEVSPRGARARQAGFTGALLIAPAAGTGEAFAVTGCFYRLYFQSGGPGGWLGLPVSDAVNTPDGQKQRFEGGVIRAYRALATCEAEPAPRG